MLLCIVATVSDVLVLACMQDTSSTAAAQAKYAAAASAAQQHTAKVQQQLAAPTSSSSSSSSLPGGAGSWQQVQAAAQQLLSTYRAASMRLQLLSSLLEGREKLLHKIQQAQVDRSAQQQQQQSCSPVKDSSSSSSSVRRRGSNAALTAFELHLLSSPQLLLQHQQALQQACSLLQQQLQCVQAAQTFFAWASSVLDEEVKDAAVDDRHFGAQGHRQVQYGANSAAAAAARHQQQQQRVLPEPVIADLLPLLQQLPAADSPLAGKVLLRVMQQLQAAAAEAGVSLSPAAAAGSLSALSLDQPARTAELMQDTDSAQLLLNFGKVAAAAMATSGIEPSSEPELLQLSADIQQQLDRLQEQQQRQQLAKEAACIVQLQRKQQQQWRRQQAAGQQPQQQQQQQQQQGAISKLTTASPLISQAAAEAADASCVAAGAELQRLHGVALHVARQLAKARAANKQQLQVAEQLLMGQNEAAAAAAAAAGVGSGSDGSGKLLLFKG
jgi:hypothetical protein